MNLQVAFKGSTHIRQTTESEWQDLLDSAKVRGRSFPPRHGLKLLAPVAVPAQLNFTRYAPAIYLRGAKALNLPWHAECGQK